MCPIVPSTSFGRGTTKFHMMDTISSTIRHLFGFRERERERDHFDTL